MSGRLFRIRMRPGSSVLGFTNDGTTPPAARAEDGVVVEEEVAAFLVKQRAAEIIEVIEPSVDGHPPE